MVTKRELGVALAFSPSDQHIYSMRFPAEDPSSVSIPFGGNDTGGSPISGIGGGPSGIPERPTYQPLPFTGTGFTGSQDHIVPEFTRNPAAGIPEGAAIYEIDVHGTERVVGIYGGIDTGWIPVDGGIR
jgi:hypothetical protein